MNIYADVNSLQKSPVETGGLCSVVYFKIEDVETWPAINPVTGIIDTAIVMKAGKSLYLCQAADKGRSYDEELKHDSRGDYMDILVTATIAGGTNTANILSLDAMKHHEWGMIVKDRGGFYRLVGNADKGAKFFYKYTSADGTTSRKTEVKWVWEYPNSAPVYNSTLFTVTIGGVIITAGRLTLIMRFRVGDAGAPMDDTDTTLTNPLFANTSLLVLADGIGLPVDDGLGAIDWAPLITRHVEKTFAGNIITFVGGVTDEEIIEIYAFS